MSKYKIKIGIIGGTGLADPKLLEDQKEVHVDTPFGKPSDALIEGKIKGVDCVFLARHGRKHTIMPSAVNYRANIWALREAGCTHILASTASGSLKEELHPGDIVVLDSFIDRTQGRKQTFYDDTSKLAVGICHLPMNPAYCPVTREVVLKAAQDLKIQCHPTGTSLCIEGPRFSSLAESKLFRTWGADSINMTTVPEVVLAKEAGLCYVAIALITDYDCWKETGETVCVEDVMKTFKKNIEKVVDLISHSVTLIAQHQWDNTIDGLRETVKNSIMLPH
ncbi:S-methyl-5'-thioadenosine phosphorylase [Schistocerca gregaria]|uniref:S-methyl-5'-thioadenosine phosphorylase n=1 Tax=Schistocerca gregaria TaxID=7010 RepID=UPI00211F0A4E|nr:S-methyl-5'-thioadenosine phosphorylase [Schistocerca gregaria]